MSTTTGSSRGGGGHGASVEIPASTKKVVQDLKEVVGNSEEEIYAMLKECNMDPNEAAQRLLNQGDPFHEVKRKRDKRKEGGAVKEVTDVRGRPGSGGNYGRGGGRSGGGRGSSLPRFGSQEQGAGRGRSYGRENGSRGSSAVSNTSPAIGAASAKPSPAIPTSVPSSAPAQAAAAPQAQSVNSGSGELTGVANGSSGYVRPAPAPQGAWASGHGTMADLLKARAAPPPSFPAFPSAQSNASSSYPAAAPSVQSSEAAEFYSSSADPVLESSVDSGNQRPIGSSATSIEASLGSEVGAQAPSPEASSVAEAVSAAETADVEAQVEVPVQRVASPPPAFAAAASEDADVEETTSSTESQQQSGGLSALGGSQFNGRPLYAPPQQPVGTQKVSGGVGLEWKAKAPGLQSSDGGSQSVGPVDPTMLVQSYQAMSLQDDEPVIIPTHFRVPEGERSHLSFGSFGTDFNTGFGSFGLEEVEKPKHVETIAAEEDVVEEVAPASVETQVEMGQSYGHQQGSTAAEDLSGSVEPSSVAHPAPLVTSLEQHNKADAGVQQSPNYFLGGAASNYPGFGLQMPQMPSGQYSYEQAESQGQDVSRIPSMVPAYDPTTSYYTSAFRGQDADRLYPPYVATNASSKYGGNVGLMTASSVPLSQEGVSPMMVSSGPSAAPGSQAGSNVQSAQTMPQQVVQTMHYAQQPHSVQYGGNYMQYQYMPQSYPYMQPPYGHHMYNSSNSGYVPTPAGSSYQPPAGSSYQPPAGSSYQPPAGLSYPPPAGSSYPPAGGSSYPSAGSAAVKFPMPQYKPVAGVGSAPHSAPGIGYGGYTTTPSGYASNPAAVSTGNASGYEDVSTSHYKDNTLYIPSQQPGDSSTVWIQTPMGRDMGPSGGMQASSYYNLASQGQHSGYAHTQQPTHGHGHGHSHPNAGYANIYHPSQAAPAASHQMLQQPQGMGGGAGNTQGGGAYQQQTQRTQQQTWNSSNY